jgi:Protein of unknown function (DUF4238)
MPRHHFVPQFLLAQWATNGQLITYRWIEAAEKVVVGRASVAAVCQLEDLHSFFGLPRGDREAPERDYFTPRIDTPAAETHAILVRRGVAGLTLKQREAWARFLVAFGVRTPETLRRWGPEQYRSAMAQAEANPTADPVAEAIGSSLIAADMPKLERNTPLKIAMELCEDPTKVFAVDSMNWWLRTFDKPAVLLGDRPLLSQPTANWPCGIALDDPNCLIALPLTPRTVFFASSNSKSQGQMRKEPPGRLLRNLNLRTLQSAVDYVFASNSSTDAFAQTHMHERPIVWPQNRKAPEARD